MRPVTEVVIESVLDLINAGEELSTRVFRGQGNDSWGLSPTLERASERWRLHSEDRHERELTILTSFKQRAHQFIQNPPAESAHLEWAALIQHFGGPTRLLDVTKSYLVATFFAIEQADGDGIVWAFNSLPLRESSSDVDDDKAFWHSGSVEAKVRLVEPSRQPDRLSHQQGAFLMPESVDESFEDQLSRTLNCDLSTVKPHKLELGSLIFTQEDVVKLRIPRHMHSIIMRFLSRSNVSAATLFQDLSGYARSLNTLMRISDY